MAPKSEACDAETATLRRSARNLSKSTTAGAKESPTATKPKPGSRRNAQTATKRKYKAKAKAQKGGKSTDALEPQFLIKLQISAELSVKIGNVLAGPADQSTIEKGKNPSDRSTKRKDAQTSQATSGKRQHSPHRVSDVDSVAQDLVQSPSEPPTKKLRRSKDECFGKPEVWARDRPTLCETLKYYNSWQSAASPQDGYVSGMLLDEDGGGRGHMDEDIVITRAGGCMSINKEGVQKQVKDHDINHATIKAFVKNLDDGVPLHLIVGNKNTHCPTDIPHKYCVMDVFAVVDIWRERLDKHAAIFYRMQKIDLVKKSWWARAGSASQLLPPDFSKKAHRQQCSECQRESPQRFSKSWMCCNHECTAFWKINERFAPEKQTYNPDWLAERQEWTGFDPSYATTAELIQEDAGHDSTATVSEICTKGIVCPQCQGCIVRMHWDAWRCQTDGCGFVHKLAGKPLTALQVGGELSKRFDGPAMSEDKVLDPAIGYHSKQHGWFRISKYDLAPGCFVVHVHSNSAINRAPGGPDDLFWNLQQADLGLKRNLMKQSVVAGQMARHFTTNFGLPYKFVVHTDSKGFSEATPEILEAVRRMSWAGRHFVSDEGFKEFNELLAVGYLEKNKMGYHDDGENELGPTVASFSLGAPATFTFRLKNKYFNGFSKDKKHYDPSLPVLPGCNDLKERQELNKLAETKTADELNKLAQKKLLHGGKGNRASPPVILDLTLKHGDIVVMHGADIQKYFEHESSPTGKLRFALTCRHVKPDMIEKDQHWKGEIPAEYTDPAKAYDGDLDLYRQQTNKPNYQPSP